MDLSARRSAQMGIKMIQELNQACKRVNDMVGVSIKLPKPRKNALRTAAVLNAAAGTGLIAAGILLSSKWCIAAGGLGIVSSIVQGHEAKQAE